MAFHGFFCRGDTVHLPWSSSDYDGNSAAPTTNGTLIVRRVADGTTRTAGIVQTISVGGVVGINRIEIDLDDDFYDTEGYYALDIVGVVIDGMTINHTLTQFRVGALIVPASFTAEERNAAADALLDRADAIDSQTVRKTLQIMAAVLAGKAAGGGTGLETFKGLDGETPRVQVTVDASGNRSAVNYE